MARRFDDPVLEWPRGELPVEMWRTMAFWNSGRKISIRSLIEPPSCRVTREECRQVPDREERRTCSVMKLETQANNQRAIAKNYCFGQDKVRVIRSRQMLAQNCVAGK